MWGLKFNKPEAISDFTQKSQQTNKTQNKSSEIESMNLKKQNNICAERAEKMQYLVYFEQIPKIQKMTKNFKT